MARQHQNILSTKPKSVPLIFVNKTDLRGWKKQNMYIKIVKLKAAIHTGRKAEYNTSWSWSKSTSTPSLLSPSKTAKASK